jgi:three-Cys-motif partner protein
MSDQLFGGNWTDQKLDKVRRYLHEYMKILKYKTWLRTEYIDAFAGTGYRAVREACPEEAFLFDELESPEIEGYRDGSSRLALGIDPPFGKYVFIEKSPEKCEELEKLKADYPLIADRVVIHNREANECLSELCARPSDWRNRRAVVFLDPFGMQVEWKTIELIASTRAVDLWYLFPIGPVNRLLQRGGCRQPGFSERLDLIFGTHSWEERFYSPRSTPSLFEGDASMEKTTDFSEIGNYILERLGSVFAGVAKKAYLMKNSRNSPLFLLCFAVSNEKAKVPALRIAEYLMKD